MKIHICNDHVDCYRIMGSGIHQFEKEMIDQSTVMFNDYYY